MKTPTTIDTADRLRNTDQVRIDGTWRLILGITDAATPAHPARLAISVCDPNGSLADLNDARPVYLDAGDTVTFRPHSTHLADATGRRPA